MAISVFQLLASQGLLRFARNDSLLGLFTALSTLKVQSYTTLQTLNFEP